MRVAVLACISLLGAVALPLSAYSAVPVSDEASNILPDDTRSTIAPALSAPAMSDNTSPLDFLNFARDAIAHRRTGEAQEAVKRTDARWLARCRCSGPTSRSRIHWLQRSSRLESRWGPMTSSTRPS